MCRPFAPSQVVYAFNSTMALKSGNGTATTPPSDLHAVSIELAPFFTEDPEGWFTQAKAQFGISNISADKTKYWYVCTALDAETSSRVTWAVHKAKRKIH